MGTRNCGGNSWHSSRSDSSWFFSERRTSFGWPGDKLPDNRRWVYIDTPLICHVCARAVLHSLSSQIAHMHHHISSREHAWLKVCVKIVCHPRVMSRSLLYLTLTPSTQAHSHLPLQSFSHSLPHNQVRWRTIQKTTAMIHGGVAEPRQFPSPIWWMTGRFRNWLETRPKCSMLARLSKAQDQGLEFWQTKSFAIMTNATIPGDCIDRVTSQDGDRAIFERLETPRQAPKVTLKKELANLAAAAFHFWHWRT